MGTRFCSITSERIDQYYYQVDTASVDDTNSWVNYNRYINTYALHADICYGYYNVMPITEETADLFNRHQLIEEDITSDNILPMSVMHHARYLYMPAITVRDYQSFISRQAVAALLSVMASYLLHMYDLKKIKTIYANPTTFQGNRLMKKMGFQPLHAVKRMLQSSNDIYYLNPDDIFVDYMQQLEKKYARFVNTNPWPEVGAVSLREIVQSDKILIEDVFDKLNYPLAFEEVMNDYQAAIYRSQLIGVAHKTDTQLYGIHPKWQGRGLGAKLKRLLALL